MQTPQHIYRIIFTGLNGTLLDAGTQSWEPAQDAVDAIVDRDIPLIFCSSKTRAEQLALQQEMDLHEPIIVENGSAVYFPPGYFRGPVPGSRPAGSTYGSAAALDVVELGIPADRVRELLDEIRRQTGLRFRRYSDMSVEEIAEESGLQMDVAAQAAEQEFSDTIREKLTAEEWDDLFFALAERGLACVEGDRFTDVFSALTDKGRGVRLVSELLRREVGPIETIGIGNGPGDADLLAAVDRPFLVQQPDETWEELEIENLTKVEGVGPRGFTRVVADFVLPEEA